MKNLSLPFLLMFGLATAAKAAFLLNDPQTLPKIDQEFEELFNIPRPSNVTKAEYRATRRAVAVHYLQAVGKWLDQEEITYELIDPPPSTDPQVPRPRPYIRFLPNSVARSRINVIAFELQRRHYELRLDGMINLETISPPSWLTSVDKQRKLSFVIPQEKAPSIYIGSWFLNNPFGQIFLNLVNDLVFSQLHSQHRDNFLFTFIVNGQPVEQTSMAAAVLYSVHLHLNYIERALHRLVSVKMTLRERRAILNQIDFRFYYTLANIARLLRDFHRVFTLAQDPNTSLEIDNLVQRERYQEATISLATPHGDFFKIRCPQWSRPATEEMRPEILWQEKTLQQAYLYLAMAWQRLLPLRSSFDELPSLPAGQQRTLQFEFKKIIALWPSFEKSKWPMADFAENFTKASPARQKSVEQFLTELKDVERHVQNIVTAQCAAHLTTPAKILEAY